jgi:hypothetical protein
LVVSLAAFNFVVASEAGTPPSRIENIISLLDARDHSGLGQVVSDIETIDEVALTAAQLFQMLEGCHSAEVDAFGETYRIKMVCPDRVPSDGCHGSDQFVTVEKGTPKDSLTLAEQGKFIPGCLSVPSPPPVTSKPLSKSSGS